MGLGEQSQEGMQTKNRFPTVVLSEELSNRDIKSVVLGDFVTL